MEKPVTEMNRVFCSKQCKIAYKKSPKSDPRIQPLISLITGGALSLAVALPWYSVHLDDVLNTLSWGVEFWGTIGGAPEVLTLKSFVYYLFALIDYQVSFAFFIVF